jgi:replication-associated recombination protein RarA
MKELGYGEEYKYSHDYQNNLQTKNTEALKYSFVRSRK